MIYSDSDLGVLASARQRIEVFAKIIDFPQKPEAGPFKTLFDEVVGRPLAVHHRKILEVVQRTVEGEDRRAMIISPVNSAKTAFSNTVGMSWAAGRKKMKILLGTHQQARAKDYTRFIKDVVNDPRYPLIFKGGRVTGKNQSLEFTLENGTSFHAASINMRINNLRADLFLIDDAIGSSKDAESEVVMANLANQYFRVWSKRIELGRGNRIISGSRFGPLDLYSHLLPVDYEGKSYLDDDDFVARGGERFLTCNDGKDWEVLCVPAEWYDDLGDYPDPCGRKPGELLWPEYWREKDMVEPKSNKWSWMTQYQQRPNSIGTGFFEVGLVKFFRPDEISLANGIVIRFWDRAWTAGGGDFTVGMKAVKVGELLIILDVIRGQWSAEQVNRIMQITAEKDGKGVVVSFAEDHPAANMAIKQVLGNYRIAVAKEIESKEHRAKPAAVAMANGKIAVMLEANGQFPSWWLPLRHELSIFSNREMIGHDDQVDCLAHIYNLTYRVIW